MMTELSKFYVNRARLTIAAAQKVAGRWTYQEITIADMTTNLDVVVGNPDGTPPVVGQDEIATIADRVYAGAIGAWDTNLDDLHHRTQQALAGMKNKYRNDPANLAVVSGLVADGKSREGKLSEALACYAAWNQLCATWSPSTTNTLTAFAALRKQCAENLKIAVQNADATMTEENAKLKALCAALEDTNVGWYDDATHFFPADDPDGQMIRSTIPTTYVPKPGKSPPTPPAAPAKTP